MNSEELKAKAGELGTLKESSKSKQTKMDSNRSSKDPFADMRNGAA